MQLIIISALLIFQDFLISKIIIKLKFYIKKKKKKTFIRLSHNHNFSNFFKSDRFFISVILL